MRLFLLVVVLLLSVALVSGLSSGEVEDGFSVLFAPSMDESIAFWISFVVALVFVGVALGWFLKRFFKKPKKKRRKKRRKK